MVAAIRVTAKTAKTSAVDMLRPVTVNRIPVSLQKTGPAGRQVPQYWRVIIGGASVLLGVPHSFLPFPLFFFCRIDDFHEFVDVGGGIIVLEAAGEFAVRVQVA